WCCLWIAIFALVGGAIVATIGEQPRYHQGQGVTEPIVSRVAFTHVDQEQPLLARNDARNAPPPIYVPNIAHLQSLHESLANLIALAEYYDDVDEAPAELRESLRLTDDSLAALRTYLQQDGGDLSKWRADTEAFLQRLFSIQLLQPQR